MADIVLDASAILSFLQREKGADIVEDLLPDAAVSANNLAEVVAKLLDHGVPIDNIEQIIAAFDFSIIDVGKDDAISNAPASSNTGCRPFTWRPQLSCTRPTPRASRPHDRRRLGPAPRLNGGSTPAPLNSKMHE